MSAEIDLKITIIRDYLKAGKSRLASDRFEELVELLKGDNND